ncbi:hypothetical protein CCC_04146 [Paramagnetospirillum magnetotacticum MS-1]|uniref:Uncharacterized protein n=1 Tax=Paramagnetospirillum magnetotacticum MS-1 TaxID=272627 RepID=A0A0C2YXE8_PARME|nr:hypothetical protein CCC_04146 [Paramagnetospirillum magnetotacticum MS-1]
MVGASHLLSIPKLPADFRSHLDQRALLVVVSRDLAEVDEVPIEIDLIPPQLFDCFLPGTSRQGNTEKQPDMGQVATGDQLGRFGFGQPPDPGPGARHRHGEGRGFNTCKPTDAVIFFGPAQGSAQDYQFFFNCCVSNSADNLAGGSPGDASVPAADGVFLDHRLADVPGPQWAKIFLQMLHDEAIIADGGDVCFRPFGGQVGLCMCLGFVNPLLQKGDPSLTINRAIFLLLQIIKAADLISLKDVFDQHICVRRWNASLCAMVCCCLASFVLRQGAPSLAFVAGAAGDLLAFIDDVPAGSPYYEPWWLRCSSHGGPPS